MSNVCDLTAGFLPSTDPLKKLSTEFDEWERVATDLPKLLMSDQLRQKIKNLPDFSIKKLKSTAEYERAMLILSFLSHAYVWGCVPFVESLPEILAKPWYALSCILKRPPVLSYASYALHNWYRFDPNRPIELGNIALLQNFLGGVDEEWFVLVHIDIEAKIIPALNVLLSAQQAALVQNIEKLIENLKIIASALNAICQTLNRMPEKCDPYIYYNRVRPYIHGWKNNPALPNGLIYIGVDDNKPQFFRGETGAQSTIIPAIDAVLGITHEQDELAIYLQEMREYMPMAHRHFLQTLEKNTSVVRQCVLQNMEQFPLLRKIYNACVESIVQFRLTHLKYASQYIHQQSQQAANSTSVGTGGTPFMRYLKKHEIESECFKI